MSSGAGSTFWIPLKEKAKLQIRGVWRKLNQEAAVRIPGHKPLRGNFRLRESAVVGPAEIILLFLPIGR